MSLEKASLSKVLMMRAEKEPHRGEQELLEPPGDTYADSTAVARPQRCLPAGLKVWNRYACLRTYRTLGHGKGRPGFKCPTTEDLQGRLQTSYTLTAHRAKDTNNCPEGVHADNNGQHNNITFTISYSFTNQEYFYHLSGPSSMNCPGRV
ncbi:hypothetical protein NEUTE1DRAFT_97794 [Neurospora tetrasperma FGSC 2508]|uniref:Uncharacterized protein n=1 Tax=Neurospora tetrasperma (strain FGSC 2508 / ATCC MYA-4615 / P0657) TaxID=510951 RepID=F8MDJ3_NEUT8|nr:uncharacterized protein NEUTE1DRAFT_97794 [Neurospora tetrasperma FGSC 2508]EGO60631.1 hypothetical protein NEUTE1DRAFT_97794 [Neurospora tetrasperma FGSC 2508]